MIERDVLKRMATVALIYALIFLLAGCSGDGSGPGANVPASDVLVFEGVTDSEGEVEFPVGTTGYRIVVKDVEGSPVENIAVLLAVYDGTYRAFAIDGNEIYWPFMEARNLFDDEQPVTNAEESPNLHQITLGNPGIGALQSVQANIASMEKLMRESLQIQTEMEHLKAENQAQSAFLNVGYSSADQGLQKIQSVLHVNGGTKNGSDRSFRQAIIWISAGVGPVEEDTIAYITKGAQGREEFEEWFGEENLQKVYYISSYEFMAVPEFVFMVMETVHK